MMDLDGASRIGFYSLFSFNFYRLEWKYFFSTYLSFVQHVGPMQYLSLQQWKGLIYRAILVPQTNTLERLDLWVPSVPYRSLPLKLTKPFSAVPSCQDVSLCSS